MQSEWDLMFWSGFQYLIVYFNENNCFFIDNCCILNGLAYEQGGIAGVFGPSSAASALHVRSICDAKEMPHIETRWDPDATPPVLNLHPHPHAISKVFLDLIKTWNWKEFTIIYETGAYK